MDGAAAEEENSGSGFDFGSFAGEAERSKREPKRTVFNRPAKKPTDPYFVRTAADELQVPEKSRSPSPAPSIEPHPQSQSQSQPETAEDNNPIVTETTLNKMKAAYMKAKLRKAANAADLEQEYNAALESFNHRTGRGSSNTGGNRVEVLSMMDTRGVLSAPSKPEDEMTIAEMVAEEKRSRGFAPGSSSSEGRKLADRIGHDKLFKDDLEYMDENAEKLARRISKKQIDLKNTAIDEVHKLNHILDTCPLCHKDSAPPIAPVVAMGTRVYLSLPTMPQLSPGAASIVPIAHRRSSLECDDDEWDEIRNFMKCLARMYHSQKRGVLFYENAANMSRRRHASIEAVPMPYELASTASAYFREAILSSDEEWSSHQKIINTLERATKGGLGKRAFRQSLVKEAPYFHVWFTLDGGYGHIIEDADRWPTGDLFAREVIGGMLELEPDVIKRQSRWKREPDPRMKGFRQMWDKFDWTKQLQDPEAETKF
ncbi:CwfJ C-terminus 1-domain-containing protein-like protein [Myxozyma melibiosi]|uniref:CwfJ C-terminus 1-domain-containing protein-like protein n=1 Tax=Myxozyma melibiosi TaxID=54550 RepID=A0ABR1FFE9_9ASCO